MGEPALHPPVMALMAAFSRHDAALDWARARLVEQMGPLALESPRFAFEETDYYTATMGAGLRKTFFALQTPFDPADLAEWKLAANRWEAEYAALGRHEEQRPLNLDPGYLTAAKLVLASTKDFAHRIYLRQGIYAEITLCYRRHAWQHHEFTFPDYRRADYQQFFSACRDWLQRQTRGG
ncbi:MAG: DUF4416 family protein [Planctomycetota bacterium]